MLRARTTCRKSENRPAPAGATTFLSLADLILTGLVAAGLALAGGSKACSQSSAADNSAAQVLSRPGFAGLGVSSGADTDPVLAERRRTMLNIQRQKQIVADSQKLLKMIRELNDEVAASASGSFTPDQLQTLTEIEKLAHSVKEGMLDGADDQGPEISRPRLEFH
jgi:hypothetical protein